VRYIVRPGDTLFSVARRFGVPVRVLIDANRIWNPSLIFVGQVLWVPAHAPVPPPPVPACAWYRVQRGDNVFRLALRFGTTVQAIATANGINPNRIYVGQALWICGSGR
jgi:putative chitinase